MNTSSTDLKFPQKASLMACQMVSPYSKRKRNKSSNKTECSISSIVAPEKSIDKLPIIRINTHIVKKSIDLSLKKSDSLKKTLKVPIVDSTNLSKYFEVKIEEKLKSLKTKDEVQVLSIYLNIFEKIIAIDTYGPVLEKIRIKIVEALNKDFSFKENADMKQIMNYQNEISHLKENIKDIEIMRKSLEAKLKKLSTENIELLNENAKLEEENNFWKDYKKNIKVVDGMPDTVPLIKELRSKNSMIDGLDKKNRELIVKEKKLSKVIKMLKEKGVNVYEILGKQKDRRNSADSFNISKMSINSNDSN